MRNTYKAIQSSTSDDAYSLFLPPLPWPLAILSARPIPYVLYHFSAWYLCCTYVQLHTEFWLTAANGQTFCNFLIWRQIYQVIKKKSCHNISFTKIFTNYVLHTYIHHRTMNVLSIVRRTTFLTSFNLSPLSRCPQEKMLIISFL